MPQGEMLTLGVDLSTDPAKTGVCLIRWPNAGSPTFVSVCKDADDDDILRLATNCRAVGIDAPFGWPRAWSRAVGTFKPGMAFGAIGDTAEVTRRSTDRFVHDRCGTWPMAVAANLIGATAIRAARIVHRLHSSGFALDLGGPRSTAPFVSEVYPAAALKVWGLAAKLYKSTFSTPACAPFIQAITAPLSLECDSTSQPSLYASDDAFDAFVASLVARAVARDQTWDAPPLRLELAAAEGWIRFPRAGSTIRGLLH